GERFSSETRAPKFAEVERDLDQLDRVALCFGRIAYIRSGIWNRSGIVGAASGFDSHLETGRTRFNRLARAGPHPTRPGDNGIRHVSYVNGGGRSAPSQ